MAGKQQSLLVLNGQNFTFNEYYEFCDEPEREDWELYRLVGYGHYPGEDPEFISENGNRYAHIRVPEKEVITRQEAEGKFNVHIVD